jgi:hypothetical protein
MWKEKEENNPKREGRPVASKTQFMGKNKFSF